MPALECCDHVVHKGTQAKAKVEVFNAISRLLSGIVYPYVELSVLVPWRNGTYSGTHRDTQLTVNKELVIKGERKPGGKKELLDMDWTGWVPEHNSIM